MICTRTCCAWSRFAGIAESPVWYFEGMKRKNYDMEGSSCRKMIKTEVRYYAYRIL